jgi:hypothetical protein
MEAIKIKKRITSDTIHIPELQKFIGKNVEIILLELPEKKIGKLKTMTKFISASGKIDIDEKAVADLRNKSIL